MKKKSFIIIIILLISQLTFADYTNPDSLKTIILTKKEKKAKIDVGDKIFIIKNGEKNKIKGTVTAITENSLSIDKQNYNFSEIKTIGAKRKQNYTALRITLYIFLVSLATLFIVSIILVTIIWIIMFFAFRNLGSLRR